MTQAEELTATEYRVPLTIADVELRTVTFVAPAEYAVHLANATATKNAYATDLTVNFVGGVKIERNARLPTITSFLTRQVSDWVGVSEQWVAILHREHRPRAKRRYQLVRIEPVGPRPPRPVPDRQVSGYGTSRPAALDDRV